MNSWWALRKCQPRAKLLISSKQSSSSLQEGLRLSPITNRESKAPVGTQTQFALLNLHYQPLVGFPGDLLNHAQQDPHCACSWHMVGTSVLVGRLPQRGPGELGTHPAPVFPALTQPDPSETLLPSLSSERSCLGSFLPQASGSWDQPAIPSAMAQKTRLDLGSRLLTAELCPLSSLPRHSVPLLFRECHFREGQWLLFKSCRQNGPVSG